MNLKITNQEAEALKGCLQTAAISFEKVLVEHKIHDDIKVKIKANLELIRSLKEKLANVKGETN